MSESFDLRWEVVNLEWDESTGGVLSARWNVVVSDEEVTAKAPGTSKFNPDPSSDSYISLESLDEETVLSWVKNSLLNYELTELRAVDRYKSMKKVSSTSSGLPWLKE
jgi:hypothetical protein